MKSNLQPFLFILLFFCTAGKALSQDKKAADRFAVFKLSPLVLFEPEGGFQMGLELPVLPNLSVQGEYAHLPFSYDFFDDHQFFEIHSGFTANAYKVEIRYYYSDRDTRPKGHKKYLGDDIQGFYVAPQAQWKTVHSVEEGFMTDEFSNEVPVRYKQQTSILKINAKTGYQIIIGNFVFDSYLGVGYRKATVNTEPEILETSMQHPETYAPINIAMGLKFGMAF